MSPTLEDELRTALRTYTADVTSRPDLVSAVRHGGSRRRRQRRLALVAAPVAVVGVIAAAVLVAPGPTASPQQTAAGLTASERALLASPTAGDLAGDGTYLARVVAAWQSSHRSSQNHDRGIFDHMLGRPTVVWAATTPIGPAAYVAQAADLRNHGNVQLDHEGPAVLWGFVGPDRDGGPTVVADGYPVPGSPDLDAAYLGADRSVLMIVDREAPVQVSWGATYTDDGRASRNWLPVTFTDGVAVLRRPAGASPPDTRLRLGPALEPGFPGNTEDPPADRVHRQEDNRLQWMSDQSRPVFPVGGGAAAAWPGGRLPDEQKASEALDAGTRAGLADVTKSAGAEGDSLWFAAGRTGDGRRLVAGELAVDTDPTRVYAVVGTGAKAAVSSAPVRHGAAVPVVLRLPDGQGWLVAAKGKTFTWSEGGSPRTAKDAALLPPAAHYVNADGVVVGLS
jgi:hypothetical protein